MTLSATQLAYYGCTELARRIPSPSSSSVRQPRKKKKRKEKREKLGRVNTKFSLGALDFRSFFARISEGRGVANGGN